MVVKAAAMKGVEGVKAVKAEVKASAEASAKAA
jgi:hypothetical protein